ncbi:porphobilinogen synthase [Candidatus Kryptobacter tengchongensis]|uniref:Delta-aminolevulinic acid dehydratase n=1 Tax=Kryptobacter tengchongensis TaxID=1643429 RepID=A0A916PCC1_KRYT1|nr:porphobilinogen synthase [Candidatus Kryptobacter tengchongensis]CUS79138.1 porphobilinogen synthase [Candidatus Kryptobacter tengchongensis]CUT03463.1 porphobilinogen synthase [Candidatus Kryptobacter tengchongensis]CUU05120.1 porphobilinogen synthase [Candidatus Kryptobacter tengchongensis]
MGFAQLITQTIGFPTVRLRRLRMTEQFRKMVAETQLSVDDFIYPLFVCPGENVKREVRSMPGVYQQSIDNIIRECEEVYKLGIPAVILFGIPERKDEFGSEAYDENGIIQRAVRALKKEIPELVVITDVCLCEYTSHGHCGIVREVAPGKYEIVNDETVDLLAREALSHAEAGADIVAPSDMMDGRVFAIRKILDENGFQNVPIMSYAAKYASGFYGPFREAAESAPKFGDRKSHQMDPANSDEALREIALDIQEGADIVMVKPALAYLDVIYRAKQEFKVPVAAYQVSGEYSMIKAAALNGWIDEQRIMLETLTAIKRAGADLILTYFAKDAARVLKNKN